MSFRAGSKYIFENNILYKDTYKIAENIQSCAFSTDQINGRTVLIVDLEIDGKTEQNRYVFRGSAETAASVFPPSLPEIKQPDLTTGGTWTTSQMGVIEIAWLDMENNVVADPLPPNVASGMTPIKWSGTTEQNTNTADANWYNYQAQTGATDGKTSNWANAKTTDGSYWVWIPRYAYKIIYFDTTAHANDYRTNGLTNTNKAWITGYSIVYGIVDTNNKIIAGTTPNPVIKDKVKTKGYTDYIPHSAFLGTGYEDLGGGFGTNSKGITGFWVAKFEMSGENASNAHIAPGNVLLSSTVKAVSKPGVSSWRDINIGNCYTNAYNYDRVKDSHLMKNSEWGAIAYLTHSRYGRNGTEVTINNNSSFITGGSATISTIYGTNTVQSSTGNPTGIYDLSGCAYEYIAAFNKASSGTNLTPGNSFASTGGNSTKYITAYSNNTGINRVTIFSDFYSDSKDVSNTGDGIHEVWVNFDGAYPRGWFSDYSHFVRLGDPFFNRGGNDATGIAAGIFCSINDGGSTGGAHSFNSFRICVTP